MEWIDIIFRLIVPMVATIIYTVAFCSANWIEIEDGTRWGLWVKCDNTTTHDRYCDRMAPGESDAYYEVARTLSCFAFVATFTLWVGIKIDIQDLDEHTFLWLIVYILTEGLLIALVAVVGRYYPSDSRWEHDNPSLGYSFWLAVATAILFIFPFITHICKGCCDSDLKPCFCRKCKAKRIRSPPNPRVAPADLRIRAAAQTSTTSTIANAKIETVRKAKLNKLRPVASPDPSIAASTSMSEESLPSPPPSPVPHPSAHDTGLQHSHFSYPRPKSSPASVMPPPRLMPIDDGSQRAERLSRLPPLPLPKYDLPTLPDHRVLPAPPSYDEVVNNTHDSPPPEVSQPEEV